MLLSIDCTRPIQGDGRRKTVQRGGEITSSVINWREGATGMRGNKFLTFIFIEYTIIDGSGLWESMS